MKIATLEFAVAAVGLAVIAAALPAHAHPAPFTIKAGTAPAVRVVAITLTSGTVPLKDTTTGTALPCTSSLLKGAVRTGTSNGSLGTIDGATARFTDCTGPFGIKYRITGYGTWNINVSDSTGGVSKVTVTNIRAHVDVIDGPTCRFDIGSSTGPFTSSGTATVAPGTVTGTYVNSTQLLTIPATNPGSLGLWNLRGSGANTYCVSPSILKQGDRASLGVQWKVKADAAAYNPISVT